MPSGEVCRNCPGPPANQAKPARLQIPEPRKWHKTATLIQTLKTHHANSTRVKRTSKHGLCGRPVAVWHQPRATDGQVSLARGQAAAGARAEGMKTDTLHVIVPNKAIGTVA